MTRRAPGYTTLELLVAATAGLLILGAVYELILRSQRIHADQADLAELQQVVRAAMEVIARDVRQAGSDPSGRGFRNVADGLPTWEDHAVAVRMDLPRDANADGDSWDVEDRDGSLAIDYGDPLVRGEDEHGDGVVGDLSPDEAVAYLYCDAAAGIEPSVDFDGDGEEEASCDGRPDGVLYRAVQSFDTEDRLRVRVERLADGIATAGPIFTWICADTAPEPCRSEGRSGEGPYLVRISLRGRAPAPGGGDRFFELVSKVRLVNLGGPP